MVRQNKDQQELERLKSERDHWRALAQERGEEITELNRRLERQEIHLRRIMRGMSGDDQEIETIQRQRDQALLALARLERNIHVIYDTVIKTRERTTKKIDKTFALLRDAFQQEENHPHFVEAAAYIYNRTQDISSEAYKDWLATNLPAKLDPPPPEFLIEAATQLAWVDGSYFGATALLQQAYALSSHPPLICDTIVRMLRCQDLNREKLSHHLEKLGEDWFKNNPALPEDSPTKLSTIQEYLELTLEYRHAQVLAGGKLTMQEFAQKKEIYGEGALKKLKRAERLREAIEAIARTLPPEAREMIENSKA